MMLPKNRRITRETEWQSLHRRSSSLHSAEVVIKYVKNKKNVSKFGFIVGVKVCKKATKRNLIKRRLRSIIQKKQAAIREGYDIILIAKPAIKEKSNQEIVDRVVKLLKRAELIK